MRWLAIAAALAAGAGPAAAQSDDCFPPPESNEAKTLAIFSVPLAFGPSGAVGTARPGAVAAALEITYLPEVDDETATPTFCRPGKGPENTDLLFAFPRPRVTVGLPGGLALEASWIPPVRLEGVRAHLFGAALRRGFRVSPTLDAAVRIHATLGEVRAPITCDEDALADPVSECFQGTRSDDRYRPNIFGVDATVQWRLAGGRLLPYAGGGYNRLQPRFQVHFVNRFGVLDDRRVEVDLDRGVLFGGITWLATSRIGITGELYAAPADAVTGRVAVRAALN